jgi:cytoskeletal protein CcmA (bactofilin family)
MSTLFDRTIAESYKELLKTASTDGVNSSLTIVEDGDATASALQISTTTVKSSGSLEVVGSATLASTLSVTGASTLTGNVSMGGDLLVAGNAVIQGTLTANGGTLTLGDADTDNVVFNADINSHILPNTDNTYDLGSAAKSWRNLHVDGTATLNNISITGSQTISATTQSTDKDTGALVVEGGVGVEKNVNVGGSLAVTETTTLSSTLSVSDTISATKASGTGLAITADATIGGNLTVTGNLTINGTTTNINTTNLVVEDKNVVLADVATPTDTTADGGGITIKGATDKTFNWVNSTAAWTSSENVNVATGKTYKINGTDVLSNNTLGSGVTGSSLTSVGTIGSGIWQGTIVDGQYGGTGVNNTGKTITLGGNLTTSGAFATTLISTAATTVTLPTTGTLATLANAETLTNKSINLANNTLTATSAQILAAVSDETGTGSLVFSDSPALTGTPTAPTATADTNTTQVATTAHVFAERSNTITLTNKTLTSPTINNGSLNMGSGTLVIPAAVTPAQTSAGSLVWDSTSSLLTIGDGTARKILVDTNSTQTLSNKTIVVSPTITLGNHLSGSLTLTNLAGGTLSATLADNVTNQQVQVSKNGSAVIGTRKRINFVEGSNVTLNITDDSANDCVNLVVTATGGGGGGGTATGADLREVWLYS